MEHYLHHLSDDLMQTVNHPPLPPEKVNQDSLINLTSGSEWTNVKQEAFPKPHLLTSSQCQTMNEIILRIYSVLKIKLADVPGHIPPHDLYHILISQWENMVKNFSGQEVIIELCTGNLQTCPYGNHCTSCTVQRKRNISVQFSSVTPRILKVIEAGYVCFINPHTLELEYIPGSCLENPEAYYSNNHASAGHSQNRHLHWDDYIMLEPLSENELLDLVKEFQHQLTNGEIHKKLEIYRNQHKHYSTINKFLSHSVIADDWHFFKKQQLETMIVNQLHLKLSDNSGQQNEKQDHQFKSDQHENLRDTTPSHSV